MQFITIYKGRCGRLFDKGGSKVCARKNISSQKNSVALYLSKPCNQKCTYIGKKIVLFAQFQIATDWTNWFQCIWSSDETTNQQTNNFFSSKKQRTSKKCSKNRIDSTIWSQKKCAFINIVRNDDILMTTYQKQKNHFKDWINSIPKLDLYNIIFGSRNFIARHSHFSSTLSKKST